MYQAIGWADTPEGQLATVARLKAEMENFKVQVFDQLIEETTAAVQSMVYSCEQLLLPEALR